MNFDPQDFPTSLSIVGMDLVTPRSLGPIAGAVWRIRYVDGSTMLAARLWVPTGPVVGTVQEGLRFIQLAPDTPEGFALADKALVEWLRQMAKVIVDLRTKSPAPLFSLTPAGSTPSKPS